MRFDIITIFPHLFDSYLKESLIKKALDRGVIKIKTIDLRKFTKDRHKTVDDRPYGGGPGMILKIEPLVAAIRGIKRTKKSKIILLTPSGKTFDQNVARKFSQFEQLIMICGRYEGFDERIKKFVDEEISIGDFVLAGGEIPAMVLIDTVARLVPGVVGKKESLSEETFSPLDFVEYPQFTRPENFEGLKVPKVLLSGNHQVISAWRKKKSKRKK